MLRVYTVQRGAKSVKTIVYRALDARAFNVLSWRRFIAGPSIPTTGMPSAVLMFVKPQQKQEISALAFNSSGPTLTQALKRHFGLGKITWGVHLGGFSSDNFALCADRRSWVLKRTPIGALPSLARLGAIFGFCVTIKL